MNKSETVAHMIEKECCRESLSDLCEEWGVTIADFEAFIAAGIKYFQEVYANE